MTPWIICYPPLLPLLLCVDSAKPRSLADKSAVADNFAQTAALFPPGKLAKPRKNSQRPPKQKKIHLVRLESLRCKMMFKTFCVNWHCSLS